jgi:UDP-N-acetylglucosamine 2-epimerase (non-hydrolysing)
MMTESFIGDPALGRADSTVYGFHSVYRKSLRRFAATHRTSPTNEADIVDTVTRRQNDEPVRLLSVVGARPNFMKVAPLVAELATHPAFQHCLVHTGQHYDETLSGRFFSELGLPLPDVNLDVGSGSHAVQTAEVMKRIEPVIADFRPACVVVVGDVNSTLAAALVATKMNIPVAHIEAGLRSFDPTMPEEINRRLTDAVSGFLFVTEQSGMDNLQREGVPADKAFLVGNVMIDCLLRHRALAAKSDALQRLGVRHNGNEPRDYGVLTLHRPSNVDDPETLRGILHAVRDVAAGFPIFFPVHPRTRKNLEQFGLTKLFSSPAQNPVSGVVLLEPLGYLDFLALNDSARLVFTDSGGIQEETTVLGVPCLTLRDNTERPVTISHGTNQLVGTDPQRIASAAHSVLAGERRLDRRPPLWDGHAAERIVAVLHDRLVD